MENKIVEYYGMLDKNNFTFLTKDGKITLENLYENAKNNNSLIQISNNSYIEKGEYVYFYSNPKRMIFFFPENERKEIFICNSYQIIKLKRLFANDYNIEGSNDNISYLKINKIDDTLSFKYIKFINPNIIEDEFNYSRRFKSLTDNLSLKDLSLNYKYYLENSNFCENKEIFFIKSEERKIFFQLIDNYLKKDNFIAFCGLEGIGKTVSILAYLKFNKFCYFYYNMKTIDKLLKEKNNKEIIQIILKEMYHFMEFENANYFYTLIKDIVNKYNSTMDILIEIIKKINGFIQTIIIDQYKTKYDVNYQKLFNLKSLYSSIQIIIISSMNEDDVKNSLKCMIANKLNKNNNNKEFLNYIYITSLVNVDKNDIELLNEKEKNILYEFGNLYLYYYKILKLKNTNQTYINFELEYKKEIYECFVKNINEYYSSQSKISLINILSYIIKSCNINMKLNEIYENLDKIPFRYFYLQKENNNMIDFNNINENEMISFNYSFQYIFKMILLYYQFLLNEININDDFNKNNIINQKSINLEKCFSLYLWGNRFLNKINSVKLKYYEEISSIIKMNDEDIKNLRDKINNLKENEGILLIQKNQNALAFDIGIIEKDNNNNYNLYLFQVTLKKESNERFTLIRLNEYILYLNGLLYNDLHILIKKNYFCYIFDFNSQDNATINYCQKNLIDFWLFDIKTLNCVGNKKLTEVKLYFPLIKYNENCKLSNNERTIILDKIKFDYNYNLNEQLDLTDSFLLKKRSFMSQKKNLEIQELNNLKDYEKQIKNNTNNEIKEFIIDNYLLENYFKDKKIPGISYQTIKINQLKKIGLPENKIKNLYQCCNKDEKNDCILNVKRIDNFWVNFHKPEYGIFIILKVIDLNKFYFLDFQKNKRIDLSNMEEKSFKSSIIGEMVFYSLLFCNKNLCY